MPPESPGWVQTLTLDPPSIRDNTADADRLAAALRARLRDRGEQDPQVVIDLPLLKTLPDLLRAWHWQARCVLFREGRSWRLIRACGARDPRPALGLAVDLGTTRVALRLVDLATGGFLAEAGFDNPQLAVGPDILTRIHFAGRPGGLEHLTRLAVEGVNAAAQRLCRSLESSPEDICLLAVAGNTAMTHLFMGLTPHWVIREPYIPAVNRPGVQSAAELGLKAHPAARALVFPNIGAYFGGDLIAGILYAGIHRREETTLMVDVGTNAEVVLGNRDWLIACAGAAGPALEGGMTRMGMTAAPGVIDRVAIDPDGAAFRIHTIDDLPPRGICGSGVIDLAAGLFRAGMIDIRGKLSPARCRGRLRQKDGMAHLVVVPAEASADGCDLTISQADIDSLVRSKAAMYTILETVSATVGVGLEEIATFCVAGTFGSLIDPASAVAIGMLPDLPLSAYRPLGNTSLEGAALALTSPGAMEEIDSIRGRITYLELNVNQDFMNRFSAAKFLPHTDTSRFPSVAVPHGK